MAERSGRPQDAKREIRALADSNCRNQADKDELSRIICERFAAQPEYTAAETAMCYVDFRDEVRTRHFLPAALEHGKRVVVPYCDGDRLGLFLLDGLEELTPGAFGILEPKAELRALAKKRVDPAELDLVMVPGVAFDRDGARLGHGKGYYDKLLLHARPDTLLVALAFECQLFPAIPMQPHDVYMDRVITEKAVYRGKGRAGGPPCEHH